MGDGQTHAFLNIYCDQRQLLFLSRSSRCRLFEEGEAHELCLCNSPVIQVDEEQQALCHSAVQNVCANELPGLGGDKTDSNTKLNNKIKVCLLNISTCRSISRVRCRCEQTPPRLPPAHS